MNRRGVLCGLAGSALLPARATAYERCVSHLQACEVGIELSSIVTAQQHMSQWCWAASIEMIFAYHGYEVAQDEIVRETYGSVVNMPAVTGLVISRNLNRTWKDKSGNRFRVKIKGLYDYDARVLGLTDAQILAALKDETPLLLGNESHAMVLVSAAYAEGPLPRIYNIGLADPWPGRGFRGADNFAEGVAMHRGGRLRYLCLPEIEEV